jgi:hypothetical protein
MSTDSLFTDDSSSFLTLPTSAFEEHVYVALWFLLFFVPYSYKFAPRCGLCVAWVVGVDMVMSKSVHPVNLFRLDDEEEDHGDEEDDDDHETILSEPYVSQDNPTEK